MAIHQVPATTGTYAQKIEGQEVSTYYFYSDYNPTEHFTYNVVFNNDNTINEEETLENQRKAFAKVVEYHFSFEQTLPKEDSDFIKLYRPKLISNELKDFNFGAKNKYINMTQEYFEQHYNEYLEQLPTKSVHFSEMADQRNMDYEDYKDRTIADLEQLYNNWSTQTGYDDATRINQHCYECALYCRIYRPKKEGNDTEFVSPYDFRRTLRMVNHVFNFKLPVEEGWYMYNKQSKKWEFIEFKEVAINE